MAEGLVHSTQLICQLLSTIEPLTVSEAIHNIQQTTMLLLNVLRDDKDAAMPLTPADNEVTSFVRCISSRFYAFCCGAWLLKVC